MPLSKPSTHSAEWETVQAEKRERRRLGILTCLNTAAARKGHVRAHMFHAASLNRMNLDGLVELYSRDEVGDYFTYAKTTPAGTTYLKKATHHV